MRQQLPLCATLLCLLTLSAGLLRAQTTQPAGDADFAQRFTSYLQQHPRLSDAQRRQILQAWQADVQDPQRKHEASSMTLAALEPDLARALLHLANEECPKAIALLEKQANSNDAMLAAHARYYLARAYLMMDQGEQAQPVLQKVLDPQNLRTPLDAEATFLLGVCQVQLLDRTGAIKTLEQFLDRYPDAPERLRVGARQMAEQLKALADGSLLDVHDRMDYSRRRLELTRTDQPTRTQQDKIIALLDKLIEEAQKKEQQQNSSASSSGSGSGSGQRRGRPSNPANKSTAPIGQSNMGEQHGVRTGKPEDQWGQLQERQRQEVLNALKTRFPDRYRELVEQYYKSLQEQRQP